MTDLLPGNVTRLLLVEGKEDQEFFIQLATHLNLIQNWPLRIIQYGGKTRLKERLRTLTAPDTMEQIERIGIVRDSDFNTDALQSVRDAIEHSNQRNDVQLDIPETVLQPTDGPPAISVLILPSGEREGMIEDLVMDLFQGDPVYLCVDAFFTCLRENNVPVSQERLPKARLRTFITGKNVGFIEVEANGGDSDRQYLSDVFSMSWWKSEFWDRPAFDNARTFLTQLLAD